METHTNPAAPVAPNPNPTPSTNPAAPVAPNPNPTLHPDPAAFVAPTPARAGVLQAAAPDSGLSELRAQVDQLTRTLEANTASIVRVNTRPLAERVSPEIRSAGEWMFYANRLTSDEFSALEVEDAQRRLGNVTAAELRAELSDSGDSPMPVQYLGELAEIVRSGRPFANALGSRPITGSGMTIERSEVSQGTIVSWEGTSEGEAGGSQEFQTTDVQCAIKAVKGVNDLTMQAALRSSPSMVDALVRDQTAAMASEIENATINGTGTLGSTLGTLAGVLANASIQDETIATWGLSEFLTEFRQAVVLVVTATNAPPEFIAMHPRRWAEILFLTDTTNRPLLAITDEPSTNVLGVGRGFAGFMPGEVAGGVQTMGAIAGIPVVASGAIPTNLGTGNDEDIIILRGRGAFELYEGGTVRDQFRSPETFRTTYGQAKVAALHPGPRPNALVTISGAGLAV